MNKQISKYMIVDLHFSHAPHSSTRLAFIFEKVEVATYFILFERENKTRNKALKNDSIVFGKTCL